MMQRTLVRFASRAAAPRTATPVANVRQFRQST